MIGRIGVCSWSLRPRGPAELARSLSSLGIGCVQLALGPLREGRWSQDETSRALSDAGITVVSGMIGMRGEDYSTLASIRASGGVRPDAHWKENLAAARESARIARGLGLPLVTLHAGFLPEDVRDPERAKLVARLQTLADVFAGEGIDIGLETGQERAQTLLAVLGEIGRANVGVNFDPANLILYGMGEPVEALRALGTHVRQVHVKDARPAKTPGEWGEEVPAGTGAVDWRSFFDVLSLQARAVDCVIEREAGSDRIADVTCAKELVERLGGGRA